MNLSCPPIGCIGPKNLRQQPVRLCAQATLTCRECTRMWYLRPCRRFQHVVPHRHIHQRVRVAFAAIDRLPCPFHGRPTALTVTTSRAARPLAEADRDSCRSSTHPPSPARATALVYQSQCHTTLQLGDHRPVPFWQKPKDGMKAEAMPSSSVWTVDGRGRLRRSGRLEKGRQVLGRRRPCFMDTHQWERHLTSQPHMR